MNELDDVFISLVPRGEPDHAAVREAIAAEGLPIDEQTQFAGKATFETAVTLTRNGIAMAARLARKLLDADKIEVIQIEYKGRKVTLRGVPGDRLKPVEDLTDHILAQLKK